MDEEKEEEGMKDLLGMPGDQNDSKPGIIQ